MLMVMDIGNSAMKVGLFKNNGVLIRTGRTGLSDHETSGECAAFLKGFLDKDRPQGAIIASVVPGATPQVAEAVETVTGHIPEHLTYETDSGLVLDITEPSSMGADRIAGALGAVSAMGAPVAVVDLGTATTIGFVIEGDLPESVVFKGGAILPGLTLMAKALSEGTAKLPEVDLKGPFKALGRDTDENILSGIVLGTVGAIERIVSDVEREAAVGFQIVLTGGHRKVIEAHMDRRPAIVEPNLTLLGLRYVYERLCG